MKFKDLLSEAQFHGAKRIAVSKYKWCWLASLVILFICSVTVIWVTVIRFFSRPTYVAMYESVRDSIPFPSVIICPEVSFPDDKMDKFVEDLNYPPSLNATYTRSVLKQFAAFLSPDVVFNYEDLQKIQELLDYNELDVERAALQLTPSCQEILLRCKWLKNIVNCSSIFQTEITRYGFCCVFNGRSLKRELRERDSHPKPPNKGVYVGDLGFNNALVVAIDQRRNLFILDLAYKWFTISTNQHYVDILSKNGSAVSPGQEVWVTYDTKNLKATEVTASLSSDLRKCHMEYYPLKYFPTYHNSYCLLECEIARTIQRCNCLLVAHPSLPGVPVCRPDRLQCARSATVSWVNVDECGCLPACNIESQNAVFNTYDLTSSLHTVDHFYENLTLDRISIIRVFLAKRKQRIFEQRSYFSTFILFSQLGGVFNVFFGCSILTLLELTLLAFRAMH